MRKWQAEWGDQPVSLPQREVDQAIEELREIRRWRFGGYEPEWLQPVWIPARELVIWRRRRPM